MITGCCSSAVAVALNKLAQREKVIYLPGISGSNDTTGKDCVRYGFRDRFYGQTSAARSLRCSSRTLGQNKKVAYLTPDYTYGTTVQHSPSRNTSRRAAGRRHQSALPARHARLQLLSAQHRQ